MATNKYWENRVLELHGEIERLRAEQRQPDMQRLAAEALVRQYHLQIQNLENQLLEADSVIKDAARYRKLRDLPWDSYTHPELWEALNECPRAGKDLDKTIDNTLHYD